MRTRVCPLGTRERTKRFEKRRDMIVEDALCHGFVVGLDDS